MATLEEEFRILPKSSLKEPLLEGVQIDRQEIGGSLISSAGIWSLLTFSWINPLLEHGYRHHLTIDDVPPLALQDQGRALYATLDGVWQRLKNARPERTPSVFLTLVHTFWVSVLAMGVLVTVSAVAQFVGPYLIEDFVEYLHGRRRFPMEGYVLVSCFVLADVVTNLSQRYYCLAMHQFNCRVRTCLTAMIYRKSLRLSSIARKHQTSGEIINYMAVDVERVILLAWWVHDFWILPLQVILSLAILYKIVGVVAAGAALVATIATVLFNSPLMALEGRLQEQLMGAKDARMKTTSECLRNMRILKLQAWECEFMSRIEKLRASEYKCLAKRMYTVAASTLLMWTSPTLVAITTFGTCIFLGVPLTPGGVLSSIATFVILQQPLRFIPELSSVVADTRVSLHRLWLFLQQPELPTDAVEEGGDDCEFHNVAIEVDNGVFSWNADVGDQHLPPTLHGVNLRVQKGTHVAVCGQVGSGKSALLACLLGEIPRLEGKVRVEGQTAYVAQTPWIQTGTFKENICFGRPMDEALYERVLQACDLKKDIAMFPFGDDTGIGERGINLSGGQKQRVQLARALYQEADVYFLDDPFSAVDAHTGSHLLKECIMGFLASKTVVYVTHQMEFLYSANHILVLRDGGIVQAGKHHDLLQMGTEFSTLFCAHNKALQDMQMNGSMKNDELNHQQNNGSMYTPSNGNSHFTNGENTKSEIKNMQENDAALAPAVGDDLKATVTSEPLQLVKEEERETGSVPFHVYWAYATAVAGGALIPIYVFSQIGFQALQIYSSYWMTWGTSSAAQVSSNKLIVVYSLLGVSGAILILVKTITVSITGLEAGQKYFTQMLQSVFRAPISFFDSTPSGRILSRMSSDQEVMDAQMQFLLNNIISDVIVMLGILALVSQITWHILLPLLPIVGGCIIYQRYYIVSGRELSRISRIHKSPIIHHFGESIAGAATIRAFHQEDRFMALNLNHLDKYATAFFHKGVAREWLTMRLQLLSVVGFTFFLIFVVNLPQGYVSPSLAGVAIMYGINFGRSMEAIAVNVGILETAMIAVERILQYCSLPSEPPLVIENARPAHNWPSQGTIEIHNLQVRYNAHSPLVLHGVSCTFDGGEKVGIVGRTGSGKSTLIQALFRAVEPAGGRIEIDKLDISTIGLHDLRSSLSIIPQDPTLFEGSMRINLDPLGKYSDAQVWEALDKCQLGDIIRDKTNKLETSVSENGENWSVGQRQLVCLGRALLKQTRIVVLDEATASVDSGTDALIQQTLRSEFSACTVITVAHRIPTIVDSDKVLVLENGRVVEHDSPAVLLQDRSSFFSKLVMEYSTRFTEN